MSNPKTFRALQDWYAARCDGVWEHQSGVTITTLDNPGWRVTADLNHVSDALAMDRELKIEQSETDWLSCTLRNKKFEGAGDPTKLASIVETLLAWTETE